MTARIKRFFTESRQELRHVNWPTRREAVRLTLIVIGMSVVLAAFLGGLDLLFSSIIKNVIVL
jgi:preprotein translocase subunit SecE